MKARALMNAVPWLLPAALPLLLGGCQLVVMNPAGDVARQEGHLILVSTLLMLLIIVPVILLTLWFGWRYRESNQTATYAPDWDHSTSLELIIWGAPLLIIIALGLITWISTHTLDPYRPLERLDARHRVPPGMKPLVVDVVALDWKWLFIYPEQGIATVNELAAPVDVPIEFRITASSVMNSFYIPALAGQIYAMPSMETQLHAVMNRIGVYEGQSAQYSGGGFSDMHFKFHALARDDFEHWVAAARQQGNTLARSNYLTLTLPSSAVPVQYFAHVENGLFKAIVERCVAPGETCANGMMTQATPDNGQAHAAARAMDMAAGPIAAHQHEAP